MLIRRLGLVLAIALALILILELGRNALAQPTERSPVFISLERGLSSEKYNEIEKDVVANGGSIIRKYRIIDAFSARVPRSAIPKLQNRAGVKYEEDKPMEITLTASDVDGDTLTYIIMSLPNMGSLAEGAIKITSIPHILGGNTVTYTPGSGYTGLDSFTFKVNDFSTDSNLATVSITVTEVNHPPVADDQSVTTDEDTPVNISLTASDANNDPLTYSVVENPSYGTLSGIAPALTYTPGTNFNGSDSFAFKANDGKVDSNITTVSITVNPVNDAPVANDDSATTQEGTALTVNVLANDTDIDGDLLTISEVTQGSNGSVVVNIDSTVTYTPNPGFIGNDTFTYTASDSKGGTDNATVSITVNPSAPTAYVSIEMVKQSFWKWWRMTATVTVKENEASGLPLEGATINGHWSDAYSGTVSRKTDKNGNVSFRTRWIRIPGTVTFTVDKVVKDGQEYQLSGETEDSITGESNRDNSWRGKAER